MKWNVGVLTGVLCGVLVMVGCSKEPPNESGSKVDASQVMRESGPSEDAIECLVEAILFDKNSIDAVLQRPRDTVVLQASKEEMVYWTKGNGQSASTVSASYCQKVQSKIVKPRISEFADDHYKVSAEANKVGGELSQAIRAEIDEKPFEVVSAVAKLRHAALLTFQPGPKDGFEKTLDYEARIAREKAAFDKDNNAKKITSYDVEYVWVALFGTPYIESERVNRESDLYNPDTETLSLTVVPYGRQSSVSGPGTENIRPPFEIPVKIKLTPEQAKKLLGEFGVGGILNLTPVVIMQMHNGELIVKEVSFKDYNGWGEESLDNFTRAGFKLDHIPVNQELSRNFLTGH